MITRRCRVAVERMEARQLLSAVPAELRAGDYHPVAGIDAAGVVAVIRGDNLPSGASAYQAQIDWGDSGAPQTALTVAPIRHGIALVAWHVYGSPGSYRITVIATVNGSTLAPLHETLRVRSSLRAPIIRAQPSVPFPGVLGSSDVPPSAGASFIVQWVNGSDTTAATAVQHGRRITFSGTNTFLAPGRYTYSVLEVVPAADSTSGAASQLTLLSGTLVISTPSRLSTKTIRARALAVADQTAGESFFVQPAVLTGVPSSIGPVTAVVDWRDGPRRRPSTPHPMGMVMRTSASRTPTRTSERITRSSCFCRVTRCWPERRKQSTSGRTPRVEIA